ncbi:MFS transporter [Anaerobacillus arseniciselenatis]|uniref:MFS transporter n=1 Tax=Anaerobacillus arseniciselenatis TaxID=85682 RepID=A0A1S2LK66_9BACI|nr:MFS transporter [Anaerobacillus arseniciselenatis]OIJ12766.1 MFS transporter [Anaerobacillus arseniciselenatis]
MYSTLNIKALLFFYFSAMTIIISYLPVYFQESGLTGSQIGFLLAVGPLAAMIAQPFWGYMTDKYKTSKKVIIVCLSGAIFSSVFLFQNLDFSLLTLVIFVFFIFMAPVGGLGDSLAQKTANQLSITFGSIRMWGSIGFAVMSLVGGFLFTAIGIQYIYLPFILFLIITLVIGIRIKDIKTSQKPVNFKEALKLVQNKKLMMFFVIMMFITVTHRSSDSFLGIYIVERGGVESFIGWAWFIGVSAEALVFATSTLWFRRFHALTFIIIAAILYSIRWFLMAVIADPMLVLPLQVMHGLTFGIFYLSAFHYVTKIVPEQLQSTGHLLFYSFFFGLSGIIGSSLGGQIIEQSSAQHLYLFLAMISLAGVVFLSGYKLFYYRLRNGENIERRHS